MSKLVSPSGGSLKAEPKKDEREDPPLTAEEARARKLDVDMCPVMTALAVQQVRTALGEGMQQVFVHQFCIKAVCAWWREKDQACAIQVLADAAAAKKPAAKKTTKKAS